MRHLCVTAALGLATIRVFAQQPFVESVEVRIVNVEVVVADARGNPVTGLTKTTSSFYEDGKLQTLTNFYEIRAQYGPSEEITRPPEELTTSSSSMRILSIRAVGVGF